MPGQGYTGHSFNDFNHCDLTAMAGDVAHNENEGKVSGIHFSNKLGRGIEVRIFLYMTLCDGYLNNTQPLF